MKTLFLNRNDEQVINSLEPGTKILFANFPADGHFNPLTGLAAHLKSIGCDVRWYTSKTYADKVEKLGIPFYGLKKALDVSADTAIDTIFPERQKYKSQVGKLRFDLINAFILRSPEYYEDIQEIYQDFPFQLMIADITFGGIPFVKEKMNIPVIAISIIPLPETSKDLAPPGLGITPSFSFAGRIKQKILRFIADNILFAKPTKIMRQMFQSYNIETGKAGIFDVLIQKSTLVLQSGTPGFEYKRSDTSKHIHFVGPLLPYSKKQEGTGWHHEKLKKYKKVILLTQGTVEKDIKKLIVPALEAFKNSDCLVIVTTGGSCTQELRNRYPQENFIIEDFIPFDDVMSYANVYVSNGGYGGVLLSIQKGLPMVVAGMHEGKNEINARVGYFKLGINLNTEKPTAEQLKKSVEEVLANQVYSDNVKKLSEEFRHYAPNELCAYFVAKLLHERSAGKRINTKRRAIEIH